MLCFLFRLEVDVHYNVELLTGLVGVLEDLIALYHTKICSPDIYLCFFMYKPNVFKYLLGTKVLAERWLACNKIKVAWTWGFGKNMIYANLGPFLFLPMPILIQGYIIPKKGLSIS